MNISRVATATCLLVLGFSLYTMSAKVDIKAEIYLEEWTPLPPGLPVICSPDNGGTNYINTSHTASLFWKTPHSNNEPKICINTVLALDQEAQLADGATRMYWTPQGNIDVFNYFNYQIWRVNGYLTGAFGVKINVTHVVGWVSDGDQAALLIKDAITQLHFHSGMIMDGQTVNMLIVITGGDLYNIDVPILGGVARQFSNETFIMRPFHYAFDDNVIQHEFSHLFWLSDQDGVKAPFPTLPERCIMSYRSIDLHRIWEEEWFEFTYMDDGFATHYYCYGCYQKMAQAKYRFTVTGDVDKSGKVNMMDIGYVAIAFMGYFGYKLQVYPYVPHPKWWGACDIDGSGKIDMMDIGILSIIFGKEA